MNGGTRRRAPERGAALAALIAVLAALACAGCQASRELQVRYLRDFVPGARGEFAPATVAIAPPTGVGVGTIGAVYRADGSVRESLKAGDLGKAISQAAALALADAGLKTRVLDYSPNAGKLAKGTDFILYSELDEISVNKHFGKRVTVHGRYFTMVSQVEIKFTLMDRFGETLYSGESVGSEVEPPPPAPHEVFLPIETDPARSLSIALSRAVGRLPLTPGFKRVLAPRIARVPAPASVATPTPGKPLSAPHQPGGAGYATQPPLPAGVAHY